MERSGIEPGIKICIARDLILSFPDSRLNHTLCRTEVLKGGGMVVVVIVVVMQWCGQNVIPLHGTAAKFFFKVRHI